MKLYLGCLSVLAPLALSGCISPNDSGSTSIICQALTPAAPTPPPGWAGSVITIVMENKSRSDIIGNSDAPYLNELAQQGALAAGYHDPLVHPSEPNYLWMVSGENFGVLDDNDPSAHHLTSTSHVADQIENAGLTWKAYEEGMGAPCGVASQGRYAAKHDPFVYFNDINGWDGTSYHPELRCNAHVVDYSQLAVDLAANALPKYMFITPNLDDDMHDGSIAQGDAWLSRELPALLASDAYLDGGVIFIMWDEGSGTPAGDGPPFIAISPNAKPGFVSQADYDTTSYLKTVEMVLGVEQLPCSTVAATVSTMGDLFTRPISPTDEPTDASAATTQAATTQL